MRKTFDYNCLDIITPVKLEADWPTVDELVETLRYQKEHYGISRFLLGAPSIGWKHRGYPPMEHFENLAKKFAQVRDAVKDDGIVCGFLNMLTIRNGGSADFTPVVHSNGTIIEITGCPQDPAFRKIFAESNAIFARIAKPAFMMLEDDYSIVAQTRDALGCFCEHHLQAFAQRCGRYYTREELVPLLSERTPEGIALLRKWRELVRDSMVSLSTAVRREIDKCNPEIPIGLMQASNSDRDGDMTEAVCRALAGPNHTPFCRIYGTKYGDICNAKNVPEIMHHALYTKQHISGDFLYYHESDTFPHTRYFLSAKKIGLFMGAAYSMGFDGSTYQTVQILDDKNEETAYGKMYVRERARFNAANRVAKQCRLGGVEVTFDPFYHSIEKINMQPFWTRHVAMFGIPYTTLEAPVAFWDRRMAQFAEHETVMKYLSKGLFLDGAAAKILCDRGYGQYIGVKIGDNLDETVLKNEHTAREVLCPPFDRYSKGTHMWASNQDACGRDGIPLRMDIVDPRAELISQIYNSWQEPICAAMARFENELGGRIVIQAMTIEMNQSPAMLNYRRQRLYHALVKWCCDESVIAESEPNIYVIQNEAIDPEKSGFIGMLTLNNLGDDPVEELKLHLPPKWQKAKSFKQMNMAGQWISVDWKRTEDTLTVGDTLTYSDYMYILAE